jgi:hypothetical protein
MTMTKSRRATTPEARSRRATTSADRIDMIATSASVTDLDAFLDEHEANVRAMVTKLWSIYGGEKGDRVVQYTQKHHSTLLSILGHHDGVIMLLTRALADSLHRLKTLEAEEKKSKAAPLPYQGVWKQGQEYLPGQFVTFAGSVWHCNKKTMARPGDDHAAYTLAVKSGRDGKDARP